MKYVNNAAMILQHLTLQLPVWLAFSLFLATPQLVEGFSQYSYKSNHPRSVTLVTQSSCSDDEFVDVHSRRSFVLSSMATIIITTTTATICTTTAAAASPAGESTATWDPALDIENKPYDNNNNKNYNDEPIEVTKLFNMVNGRRASSFRDSERVKIDALIDAIAAAAAASQQRQRQKYDSTTTTTTTTALSSSSSSLLLPGKWKLVYLQPGPTGVGIDRRIPFPDFDFNNNYQIFGNDFRITNIGELLGPYVIVKVQGEWKQLLSQQNQNTDDNDDDDDNNNRLLFQANIQSGQLCVGGGGGGGGVFANNDDKNDNSNCIALPISGEGLFESVYIGKRLRIGQNINGGGARVVQIRME